MTRSTFKFSIDRWCAWAPSVTTIDEWRAWASAPCRFDSTPTERPKNAFLDPMLRRRCKDQTRAALEAVFGCLESNELGQLRSVFASQYGEASSTVGLLKSLARNEKLSPMDFSLSVHNSASGIYSIATANHHPSTAIAAQADTFSSALIEALLILESSTCDRVLLVMSDQLLPSEYNSQEPQSFYSLALVLGERSSHGMWTIDLNCRGDEAVMQETGIQALDFLVGMLSPVEVFSLPVRSGYFRFEKPNCAKRGILGR